MRAGWKVKKLEDIAYLAGRIGWKGLTAKEYTREGPLFLSVHGLNYGDYVDFRDAFHISQERYDESPEIMLQKDDILLCKDGAGIGKLGIVNHLPAPASINSSLLLIRANESIMPMYLYRVLCGPIFQRLVQERIDGATTPHLYQREIKQIEVPLPPLEEQKRIVAILDEAFEGIEKTQANAKKNLANTLELFESVIHSVFVENGQNWDKETLGSVCENLDSKRVPITKSKRKKGEIPYYGASGIVDYVADFIFDEDLLLVSEDGANLLARTYPIAFSVSGKTWVNNHAHVLRFHDPIPQKFIEYYLNSISLEPFVSGMAQPKLNQKALNSIPVPYPSIIEQENAVATVDNVYRESKKLRNLYKQKLKDLAELKLSLLQKAFSGELISSNVVAFTRPVSQQQAVASTSPEFGAHVIAYGYHWHEGKRRNLSYKRVKTQKFLHLTESVSKIELGRLPQKCAAGPHDEAHMRKIEAWAKESQFFEFVQRADDKGYDFKKLANYNRLIGDSINALKPYQDKIQKLLTLLLPMNTRQAKVLATVHAAWNNLLLDNAKITDDAIIHEARENWTDSKRSIPERECRKAITTIRNNGIVPDGSAKRVTGQESLQL